MTYSQAMLLLPPLILLYAYALFVFTPRYTPRLNTALAVNATSTQAVVIQVCIVFKLTVVLSCLSTFF